MNSQDIDEDSVDIEALQAQIDISMSFAQNLVSSWVTPHKLANSSRNKDLERELSDYMRRPPRLGVGAVIPESHSQGLSRETARLKGKLAGSKKRPREQDDVGPSQPTLHDEDESRAISIKKKPRVDPFDVVHGTKKKHQTTAMPNAQLAFPVLAVGEMEGDSSEEVEDVIAMLNDPTQLNISPAMTKNKPKLRIPGASEASSDTINGTHKPGAMPDGFATGDQLSLAWKTPGNKNSSLQDHPNKISPKSTKLSKPLSAELAKVPLLNLNGPLSSDHESDGDPSASTPSSSPKKKRRRRKKKKHLANRDPANTCASPSAIQSIPTK